MAEFRPDAQHPATPVRLQQAQQQGDVPKSQELAGSIQLFCGLGIIYISLKSVGYGFAELTSELWTTTQIDATGHLPLNDGVTNAILQAALLTMPLLLAIWGFSILAHVLQNPSISFGSRGIFNAKFLNPTQRMQRLFSTDSLLRSVLGIPKIVIITTVFLATIWRLRISFANLPFQSAPAMLSDLVDCIFTALMVCAATMTLVAIADYLLERFSYTRRLRMTDQELREENRMQQGDPQVSTRRNAIFREIVSTGNNRQSTT